MIPTYAEIDLMPRNICPYYKQTRKADKRITTVLLRYLDFYDCQQILDVGAGSCNYSQSLADCGKFVFAVEPDPLMLCQSVVSERIRFVRATAEQIPLRENAMDAAICVNALHQFNDVEAAFRQMARTVGKGPIIALTADRRQSESNWIKDYFPGVWDTGLRMYPPLQTRVAQLHRATGKQIKVESFPIPYDMQDHFFGAGWRTPWLYTHTGFLQNISTFIWSDRCHVSEGVARLSSDLASGKWYKQYANIESRTDLDFGYKFLIAV